jgi:DNA-binding MarR family transcriptional regulator
MYFYEKIERMIRKLPGISNVVIAKKLGVKPHDVSVQASYLKKKGINIESKFIQEGQFRTGVEYTILSDKKVSKTISQQTLPNVTDSIKHGRLNKISDEKAIKSFSESDLLQYLNLKEKGMFYIGSADLLLTARKERLINEGKI